MSDIDEMNVGPRWYVAHTYSGYESKVKANLEKIVENRGLGDKIPAWFKGLKSECGKITWCSKDKLKKNTVVVVIIILAIAAVIAVLDFTFSSGVALLGGLGK